MATQLREQAEISLSAVYRFERELGRGGMAIVYLAEDLKHRRKVAVKVLRPELGATLGAERFLREIEVTAALQHPHILPLHDSGRVGELLYYAMPYVEGESLRDRLTRERQLPVEETLRLARDVAAALDYAHRRGVIHRDVKPENILLHDGRALVADFGIARAVQRAADDTLTGTGVSVGTPAYMSPEQAAADREVDARTDIYSLGCVVYEMLTGEPPFTAPTAHGVIARLMTEEPRRVADVRPSVPSSLSAAVQRAL
ncbi:MAG: serine/threonine protein kinase, partial [Gemmatimonadetes bacterium]|nr:serine/threonine protein kinase [Gemmatimonadota bacterium]